MATKRGGSCSRKLRKNSEKEPLKEINGNQNNINVLKVHSKQMKGE
jgi:hypothetical protein